MSYPKGIGSRWSRSIRSAKLVVSPDDREKWTDKTYANDTSNAWNVNLKNGNVNNGNKTSTFNTYYVWPVRAGE